MNHQSGKGVYDYRLIPWSLYVSKKEQITQKWARRSELAYLDDTEDDWELEDEVLDPVEQLAMEL